ncbi:MAG: S41 family peptidase [Candidatus Aminicenantes bacterium]|nr:S41 family peptidase [Candidatus Aminicenantes bacterium]
MLASVKRRNGEKADWDFPGGATEVYQGRIAILIDEGSGSASEVFAGAMQEMGRAVVLGRTSYGGALNNTPAQLPTGGILRSPHSDTLRGPSGRSWSNLFMRRRSEGRGQIHVALTPAKKGRAKREL